MKQEPFDLPAIDITDLIAVMCKIRPEHFRFERHVALRTFSAWMFWPTEPKIVNQAKIVSAGQVIRMILAGNLRVEPAKKDELLSQIQKETMPPALLAEMLINPPLKGRFCVDAEEAFGVTDVYQVMEFFISCPTELKPSLNKAIHFKKNGGLPIGASSATLKNAWVRYLISAPFNFVNFPAIDFQPDDVRYNMESINLLQDQVRLRRYFGSARYVQERLLERLDKVTLAKFKLGKFPSGIDAFPVDLEPYSPHQIEIIKSYRAPKIHTER